MPFHTRRERARTGPLNPLAKAFEDARTEGGGISPGTKRTPAGELVRPDTTRTPRPKTKREMQSEAADRVLVARGKLRTRGADPKDLGPIKAEIARVKGSNREKQAARKKSSGGRGK
jgi:hypothetical protein